MARRGSSHEKLIGYALAAGGAYLLIRSIGSSVVQGAENAATSAGSQVAAGMSTGGNAFTQFYNSLFSTASTPAEVNTDPGFLDILTSQLSPFWLLP